MWFGLTWKYVYLGVPVTGLLLGKYLDDQETLRMIRFRDKSALYGRPLGPDENLLGLRKAYLK